MSEWLSIGALEDFPPLGARVVNSGAQGEIAVFRTAGDELYALRDRCPHQGGPLSEGMVYGTRVACPLHNWSVDLHSGEAVAPDKGCTGYFPVRLRNGMVEIQVGGVGHGRGD